MTPIAPIPKMALNMAVFLGFEWPPLVIAEYPAAENDTKY